MRPDISEALRYLGVPHPTGELRREAERMADELSAAIQPRYFYRVLEIERLTDSVQLKGAGIELTGATALGMLAGCGRAVLLGCTLGARFDARLLALQARDMAKAVLYDALGSAFVEEGCNQAEDDIAARFPDLYLTDRFSPGYGDLPLDIQPALCAALDAERRLGVTVTPSLLMNPVKSVTAIIGLSDTPQPARIRGCAYCDRREHCQFRKEGKTCGA
ncbi:MAG: methionine synthase [Oscillospiraceae bacterium]|nr:methionine synthase [Oscillospiraceae bacterium]